MFGNMRELILHQEWADQQLLNAVGPYAGDDELRSTLHHIVAVQRYFLSRFRNTPFDTLRELTPPASLAELEVLFRQSHRALLQFVDGLSPQALSDPLPMPAIPGTDPSLAQALLQVVMHSQNHRGQCLRRLRHLGATPPTLDFIIWVKNQPAGA